jgi:hypothetical protein
MGSGRALVGERSGETRDVRERVERRDMEIKRYEEEKERHRGGMRDMGRGGVRE